MNWDVSYSKQTYKHLTTFGTIRFYRAMLRRRGQAEAAERGCATTSCLSVSSGHRSVCLSVSDDQIFLITWDTSKIIPRLISLRSSLLGAPRLAVIGDLFQ